MAEYTLIWEDKMVKWEKPDLTPSQNKLEPEFQHLHVL